jgi:hypothetical protein
MGRRQYGLNERRELTRSSSCRGIGSVRVAVAGRCAHRGTSCRASATQSASPPGDHRRNHAARPDVLEGGSPDRSDAGFNHHRSQRGRRRWTFHTSVNYRARLWDGPRWTADPSLTTSRSNRGFPRCATRCPLHDRCASLHPPEVGRGGSPGGSRTRKFVPGICAGSSAQGSCGCSSTRTGPCSPPYGDRGVPRERSSRSPTRRTWPRAVAGNQTGHGSRSTGRSPEHGHRRALVLPLHSTARRGACGSSLNAKTSRATIVSDFCIGR